jgi:hypothetical protein
MQVSSWKRLLWTGSSGLVHRNGLHDGLHGRAQACIPRCKQTPEAVPRSGNIFCGNPEFQRNHLLAIRAANAGDGRARRLSASSAKRDNLARLLSKPRLRYP